MSSGTPLREADDLLLRCLENLQKLRTENLDPALYWPRYLEILMDISPAEAGVIAVSGPKDSAAWQPIAFAPLSVRSSALAQKFLGRLDAAAAACKDKAGALPDPDGAWAAVRLSVGVESQKCLALFYFGEGREAEASEGAKIFELLRDIPAQYQLARTSHEAVTRREQFATVLDLMTLLNAQGSFRSAAMTFCNELAARHQCERVSLGWYKDGYVRLQVMSHVDD